MCITSKISLFSYLGNLPPLNMASGESFANKKSLPPRDYLYKHCVSKSATYNKKKYEKCHPKVFNSPKLPLPLEWPHMKIS